MMQNELRYKELTEKALVFFGDICKIPHGSGNCARIGDYLMKFAGERGLNSTRDEMGNVFISAPAIKKENIPENTVILQGHQDMVCVKEDSCNKDMKNDPLDIIIDNGIISARGTSLGADNGIGVAMTLAVLDETDDPRPPIEAIFTVDEETGMSGAAAFDKNILKGKMFINLDSEEEGVVTCACAGGERIDVKLGLSNSKYVFNDITKSEGADKVCGQTDLCKIGIHVSGLAGGHSGCDINKGRLNALRVITDILVKIKNIEFCLADYAGGNFDNVICSDAAAVILVERKNKERLFDQLNEIKNKLFIGYVNIEKSISVDLLTSDSLYDLKGYVLGVKQTKDFLSAMNRIPQGVTLMMKDRPDCVDTSMNLGVAKIEGKDLILTFSLRSGCDDRRRELEERVTQILSQIPGCKCNIRNPYPAWTYAPSSRLRDIICETYKEMYGREMETAVTHGGLECGYFASGIKGCDLVSIGPNIDDIHSVNEKISIDSLERTVKLLIGVLNKI